MLPESTHPTKRELFEGIYSTEPKREIKKINTQQDFPWQPGIQPVSRGWIGLDAECAEVILLSTKLLKVYHKNKKLQTAD